MIYQQIPALFYSLQPRFRDNESVRITSSQFEQLNELIGHYCYTHDVPRLKSLMKRVKRRMEQHSDHHIWHTEFDFISNHLMKAMKEAGFCRLEDDPDSVVAILNRSYHSQENSATRKSRKSDHMMLSKSVKNIFERLLH
jgi:Uri superfamily endonuclease